jgi:diguanylate cyclase (GGDEF)-like protein
MTEEVRAHVQALEEQSRQLRAGVSRLGDALGGTHDLDRILAVVLETATVATGARAGAVLLRDAATGELSLSAGRNLEERGVPVRLRVPADVGISGGVARSGRPVRGRSGGGRGELQPGPGEPSGEPVVAVPLTGSGTVVGVLLLWDRDADQDFTDDDLAMLRTFTSQATVAVDNVLLHEEARRLSVTDGLTGLANYRGFTVTVGKEVERAVRFERPLALLLLDLDHFKLVNDVWGHPRGDAVLVELATRVRAQVRDVDTLARYGGEEFVVVLPETGEAGAVQAAERICAAVRRRPFGEDGEQPIDVTLSLGIAVFPVHGTSSTALLRRADEALYAAKRGGRDGWRLAPPQPAGEVAVRPS